MGNGRRFRFRSLAERREYVRIHNERWRKEHRNRAKQISAAWRLRRIERLGVDEVHRQEREKRRRWNIAHPGRRKLLAKLWYDAHKDRHPQDRRLKKYGLTEKAFQVLRVSQEDRCAICGVSFAEHKIHVDHSHQQNRVRGLLCTLCNSGLGHFRDNEMFLINAAAYLVARSTRAES